jgi:hypothetical protein
MNVAYLHIPGYGWWYVVTVIEYYSRYLLACYFVDSYSAANANYAIDLAQAEIGRHQGQGQCLETQGYELWQGGKETRRA